jgi:hypothetical protein
VPSKYPAKSARDKRKAAFLVAFQESLFIGDACKKVNMDRTTFYYWLEHDPIFAAEFETADQEVTEIYEKALAKRALESDTTALIFALKARNPKKYTERFKHEIEAPKFDLLFSELLSLLKQRLISTCPHCRTKLTIREDIAKDMLALSARLEKSKATGATMK